MPLAMPEEGGKSWQYGFVRLDVVVLDPDATPRLYGSHASDIVHDDKHFEPVARMGMPHVLQDLMIGGRSMDEDVNRAAGNALNAARIEQTLKTWRIDLTDTAVGAAMRNDARHLVAIDDLVLIRGVGPARTLEFAYQAYDEGKRLDLRPLSKVKNHHGFMALRLHSHAMIDRAEYEAHFSRFDGDAGRLRRPLVDLDLLDIPDVHAIALEGLARRACTSFVSMPFASIGMDKLVALQSLRRLLFEREGADPYTRLQHSVFRSFDPVSSDGLGEGIAAVVSAMDADLPKGREYEHAYLMAQAERFPEVMAATGHADLAEFSL